MRRVRSAVLSLCLLGGVAACVPPTPAGPGWTQASPSYGGKYTNAMISGDGGTVVSRISGTRRIAVEHLASRRHSTFELPPSTFVTQVSHDGGRVAYQEYDFAAGVIRTGRLDVATGAVTEIASGFETIEFSGDLGVAASVRSCDADPCNLTLATWSEATGTVERELPIAASLTQLRLNSDGSKLLLIATTYEGDGSTTALWEVGTASGNVRRLDISLPSGASAIWPTWWSGNGSELRADVLLDTGDWEVRSVSLREGSAPVEIEPCHGRFSPNGRYCVATTTSLPAIERTLSVTDRVTGTERRLAVDDRDPRGPKVDTYGTVSDDGRVAFGFHSDLEPDWPVYVAGVTP